MRISPPVLLQDVEIVLETDEEAFLRVAVSEDACRRLRYAEEVRDIRHGEVEPAFQFLQFGVIHIRYR